MPTFLQDNKMLAWILAAIAFGVAIILILKIVEIAVDLRRRLPNGARSRQLRLGFVETFDLDGERQLLLVRRDNVEHLLLIGGPNDVLVESGIVRVEPRESRGPRPVDIATTSIPVHAPGQVPAPPPATLPLPEVAAAIETAIAAAEAEPVFTHERHFNPAPGFNPEPPFNPAPAFVPEPVARPAPAPAWAPPPPPPPPPVPDQAHPVAAEHEPAEPLAPVPTPPVERRQPRFPLPPRNGPSAGPAFAPPKPLGPPPRFAPPNFTPAGQKGEAPPPRPRFVMPPIARRANPVALPPIVSHAITPPPPVNPVAEEPVPVPPPVALEPHPPVVEPPIEVKPEPVSQPEVAREPEPSWTPPESSRTPSELVATPEHLAPPPPKSAPEQPFDADFEPLESLEEEMAKLLGRPLNK